MTVTVTFLGAAGTVTGSKYLVQGKRAKILVDAGLFQGSRKWREKNWDTPPCDLSDIDAVLLTHAHIDHIGILPRFSHLGLHCPVFSTRATRDLARILLPDSARLQEEEAEWRNKKGKSRHHPALPLYTVTDSEKVLRSFKSVPVDKQVDIAPGVKAEWKRMGHILGACSITLEIDGKKITFSGDVGRYTIPILKDPEPVEFGDLLLIESTYGNRLHDHSQPQQAIERVVNETVKRDGVVVIPSFAVGRAQLLLYYIRELKDQGKIPDIPIIIDSPMAQSATEVYRQNIHDYDEEALELKREGSDPFAPSKLYFTKSQEESKQLNRIVEPMVIISASGMLSGGRILHHLKHRISSPNNTILFVGYQPPGGRGDWILRGESTLRIFGDEVDIRAEIESISGLSAHADRDELLRWCEAGKGLPGKVAVVHGEPDSAHDFAQTLRNTYKWQAEVPEYLQALEI
jgi:metallo-beta-lactamase family protein